ncbi:hypothetical protein DXG03_002149 [Asterophora parasitica]|uniref:Uncharacterized protein n=1 Tax=Asterophora parasitica TaxID=117018 RepID=A0A9P7G4P6_9AGAR|nr:hypothetical protein DXG03_002149 [Asterophora parasitica]
MGANAFCLKACDPAGPNAAHFCEHIFDRIGCAYNAPNRAQNNVFESCLGENQDFPGVYVENGVTRTYTQPPESLGDIATVPYVARVPASSSCSQFQSADLFPAAAATAVPAAPPRTPGAAGTTTETRPTAVGSSPPTGTSAGDTAPAPSHARNGAGTLSISGAASTFGVVLAGVFLT